MQFKLNAADVIHSFWVPELHGKLDLIPGRTNTLWIQADEPGQYWALCAEFCGIQHAKMLLVVVAEPRAAFDEWLTAQRATAVSVSTTEGNDKCTLCDLHSHGNMRAFFSQTDNADEQAARIYAVIGNLDSVPEIRLRIGVYGYWMSLPVTAVFTDSGPFKDLYQEKQK